MNKWNDQTEYLNSLLNKREEIWLRHNMPSFDPYEHNNWCQEMRETFTSEELDMMRQNSK